MNSKVVSAAVATIWSWDSAAAEKLATEIKKAREIEKINWKEVYTSEADLLAEFTLTYVNGKDMEKDVFVNKITNAHRQLQAQVFQLFMRVIRAWANVAHYDERNEYVIKTCRKIVEAVDE